MTLANKIIYVSGVQFYKDHLYVVLYVHHPKSGLCTCDLLFFSTFNMPGIVKSTLSTFSHVIFTVVIGGGYFGFPIPDKESETQMEYAARLGHPAQPGGLELGLCDCKAPALSTSPHNWEYGKAESFTNHSQC